MELQKRYRWLFRISILSAIPLLLVTVLFMSDIGIGQMIVFFGLEVNEQSIMLFILVALMVVIILAFSLLSILALRIQQGAIAHVNKKIKENPGDKFYTDVKKMVE